ncbi:triose-phosphate transporter family-domain-containing protein [Mrakia frigida]|uniref:triose-phosphate transporter family-domain-containing protein n=1 Tax=Mrakia frigida TaxID=29902 RepID=UPI003FCC1911
MGTSSSFQRSPSPTNPPYPSSSSNPSSQPLRQIQESILGSSSVSFLSQFKFIFLCSLWYMSSAISSNTGKAIFNLFKFPVTLTIVQFFFVALYCWLWTRPALGMGTLREPSRALLRGVLPMAAFQIGGHVFSSVATSRVPVSTVHTIKALSPLFTVLSYRFLFNVSYTSSTYVALIPLTLGVMFACSFDVSASNVFGLICAFGSTLVFVSSNIFFKKIVPSTVGANASSKDGSASTSGRLDKINLLFFSSSMAFTFMIPLWIYSDFLPILADSNRRINSGAEPRIQKVLYYFFLNGMSHFAQNILAFTILSSTSPVTYSIASLVKRIVVILMAIVWFGQSVHPIQAMGIALTFVGLYMYQNAKGEVEKVEKKVRKIEAIREGSFLPSSMGDSKLMGVGGGGGGGGGEAMISPFGTKYSTNDPRTSSLNGLHHNHSHNSHQPPPLQPPPRHHPPNGATS